MNPRDAALINDAVRFVLASVQGSHNRINDLVSRVIGNEREVYALLIEFSKISARSFRPLRFRSIDFRVVEDRRKSVINN